MFDEFCEMNYALLSRDDFSPLSLKRITYLS